MLYNNIQVIAPLLLAFIGRNTDRNIVMDASMSKLHDPVLVETVFRSVPYYRSVCSQFVGKKSYKLAKIAITLEPYKIAK